MGNRPGEQMSAWRRLRLKGVVPLEVWDLVTECGPLWECRDLPDFPRLLMQAIEDLRVGRGLRIGGALPAEVCRCVDFLFVGGGDTHRPGLAEALAGGTLPFYISPDGVFVGEAGGFALLREAGLSGPVVDVGQTAIKVSTESQRLILPRRFEQLPLASVVGEGKEQFRRGLREFVAGAIRQALGCRQSPLPGGALVLALPCELDACCVPGPCSYPGLEGDAAFVEDVLHLAGLGGWTALVLNDAELAAASARRSPHVPADRTTLVLTLGFGVGAALLLPGDGHVL